MPITIPTPEGLDLSQVAPEEQFDLPVTFTVTEDGELYILAVDGLPLEEPEMEEDMDEEMGFADAVESGMMG
jgi:hypothetical protein